MSRRLKDLSTEDAPQEPTEPQTETTPPPAAGNVEVRPPKGADVRTEVKHTFTTRADSVTTSVPEKTPPATQPLNQHLYGYTPPTREVRHASPLMAFLAYWQEAQEQDSEELHVMITRRPDSARASYLKTCNTHKSLGVYPFNTKPSEFVKDVQAANDDSGGEFNFQVLDENEFPFSDEMAVITYVVIDDPKGAEKTQTQNTQVAEARQPEKPKSFLDEIRRVRAEGEELDDLLGIDRKSRTEEPDETLDALKLIRNTGAIETASTVIRESIQAAANAAAKIQQPDAPRTWKDRGFDVLEKNERVQDMVGGLAETLVGGLVNVLERVAGGRRTESNAPPKESTRTEKPARRESPKPEPQGVDLFGHLIRECKAHRLVNVKTDKTVQEFSKQNPGTAQMIKGALRVRNVAALRVALLEYAISEGKEMEMREMLSLPWADEFIQHLKDTR